MSKILLDTNILIYAFDRSLVYHKKSLAFFETMIRKYNPRGNRVYDIEIVSIMMANDLKKIATANIGDFKNIDEIEIIEIN